MQEWPQGTPRNGALTGVSRARRGVAPFMPLQPVQVQGPRPCSQVHGQVWLGNLCLVPGLLFCCYPFSILNDFEQGSPIFLFSWALQMA